MALEQQISLALDGDADRATNGVDARPSSGDVGDDSSKAPRLPRWTRQEILVLIQGKRDAENGSRGGRSTGLPFGSGHAEPKWSSVSSYCKKHGVNRGPVQCRKRWSNLAGDYKKIKEWESQIREEAESFWVMRNDFRRKRKLPGFFDKEVYDILDAGSPSPALALALASAPATATAEPVGKGKGKGKDSSEGAAAEEPEADREPHLYDSNRRVAGDDGLFSDFEQEEVGANPEKEASRKDVLGPTKLVPISGATSEKQPASNPEMGSTSQGGRKRKWFTSDGEEETLQYQLIDILERNGTMLSAQLEAQNNNLRLDRKQQKDNAGNLVAVLDKLADALGRIADKL